MSSGEKRVGSIRIVVSAIVMTLLLLSIFSTKTAHAFFTSEFSLTEGYWQAQDRSHNVDTLFNWKLNHISPSGVETLVDMGFNDDIVQRQWSAYTYEAYVSVPLSKPLSEGLPSMRSRVQAGRQLLTEGFEMAVLDGIQIPYYLTPTLGIWIFGGATHSIDMSTLNFNSQVYGASLFKDFSSLQTRIGYVEKNRGSVNQNLVHAQVLKKWDTLNWQPALFLKGQIDTDVASKLNQGLAELSLAPTQSTAFILDYSLRDVNRLYSGESETIYRLLAISPVKSTAATLNWMPRWDLGLALTLKRLNYTSQAGEEIANQASLSSTHRWSSLSFGSSLNYLNSYKLNTYDIGANLRKNLPYKIQLVAEGDIAKINKINGISGWAYHERSGFYFSPLPQLLTKVLLELESNHVFAFDTRLAVYVSYFYF